MAWQPKNLTVKQMAERRTEGVRLLQVGEMSQAEIARHLGVSEATVSKWRNKLDQGGPDASQARKASGRLTKLSAAEKQKLVNLLEQGA